MRIPKVWNAADIICLSNLEMRVQQCARDKANAQERLDDKHKRIVHVVDLYLSGVIMMTEFADAVNNVAGKHKLRNLAGLIDPITGLRYK